MGSAEAGSMRFKEGEPYSSICEKSGLLRLNYLLKLVGYFATDTRLVLAPTDD